MRKGQFEILGLAIVVLLLAIVMLFMVRLTFDQDEDISQDFFDEQYNQNFVQALRATTLDHCDGTIADYLVWIVNGQNPRGPDGDCLSAEKTQEILDLVENTATEYTGKDFYFSVHHDDCTNPYLCPETAKIEHEGIELSVATCNPLQRGSGRAGIVTLSRFPVPGDIEIVFTTCHN